ncbi:hypothetical protein HOLleu_41993 [Holothuria leucospilota]|uniref:Endonuclease/exonuclease/phosphatase domain-containing protein n=1 Tax=Holothuria leucospilota TaxID=206669 RepID=A0A9Q0YEP6_HOLLE|nr:hypothetical protein HOLleu_41993 [Holothuria leucospilota]
MGDFNCNLLNPADNRNLVDSYSYRPLHSIPTRVTSHCTSLLDVIFTNSLCLNFTSGVIVDDISDHFPVFILANLDVAASKGGSTYFKRDLNHHSLKLLRSTIQNESWTDVLQSSDVDSAFDCFHNIFLNHLNNYLPWVAYTKRSTHQTSKNWITPAILNSCKTKNRLHKKFLRSRSIINLNEYKRFRNRLTSVIRQAKKSYFSNLFSNSTQDTKSMRRSINTLLYGRGNNYILEKINHHGSSVLNPLNVSNIFNDYFIDIGPATQAKIPPSCSSYKFYLPNAVVDSLFISQATHEEVLNIIFSLKNSPPPRFDGIPTIIVKHIAYSLCTPLTHLFNLSLEKGIVPSSLKIARVVPVYKSGDKDSVNN